VSVVDDNATGIINNEERVSVYCEMDIGGMVCSPRSGWPFFNVEGFESAITVMNIEYTVVRIADRYGFSSDAHAVIIRGFVEPFCLAGINLKRRDTSLPEDVDTFCSSETPLVW
jgi:hypothetical protein